MYTGLMICFMLQPTYQSQENVPDEELKWPFTDSEDEDEEEEEEEEAEAHAGFGGVVSMEGEEDSFDQIAHMRDMSLNRLQSWTIPACWSFRKVVQSMFSVCFEAWVSSLTFESRRL